MRASCMLSWSCVLSWFPLLLLNTPVNTPLILSDSTARVRVLLNAFPFWHSTLKVEQQFVLTLFLSAISRTP